MERVVVVVIDDDDNVLFCQGMRVIVCLTHACTHYCIPFESEASRTWTK